MGVYQKRCHPSTLFSPGRLADRATKRSSITGRSRPVFPTVQRWVTPESTAEYVVSGWTIFPCDVSYGSELLLGGWSHATKGPEKHQVVGRVAHNAKA